MKRILAILLALCMIGSIFPLSALADNIVSVNALSSSVSSSNIGGTYAKFQITYNLNELANDVKENLLANGFYVGIAFKISTLPMYEQNDGNWNCPIWDFGFSTRDNLLSSGTFDADNCIVDQLIPGKTYNYFACIMDKDRHVVARESFKQFTTTNDASSVVTLNYGDTKSLTHGGRTMFLFTPTQAQKGQMYAVVGTNLHNIDVQDEDGEYVSGANQDGEPSNLNAVFIVDKPVYISAGCWDNDKWNNATVSLLEGSNYIDPLSSGQNDLHTDQFTCFTARESGWYSFQLSGDPDTGGMHRLENGNWQYCDRGHYEVKLNKDDSVILQGRYDEGRQGTRKLTVTKFTPPTEDSIVSAAQPTFIGNTGAEIAVTLNITETTANAGYRWGVLYSVNPTFTNQYGDIDAMDWTQDSRSAANGLTLLTTPDQLVPGKTYYYCGVLFNMNTGEEIYREPTVHSFTTASGNDGIVALTLGVATPIPLHQNSTFTFTAPANGVYVLVSQGPGHFNLKRADGSSFAGDWNRYNSPDYDYKIAFTASAEELIYIHTNNHIEDDDEETVTILNAAGIVDKLTVGTPFQVHDSDVVSFTAPSAGTYRIMSSVTIDPNNPQANVEPLHIYNPDTGDWDWLGTTTGLRTLAEDETLYFITWFDENQVTDVSLIAEKITTFNANPTTEAQLQESLAIAQQDLGNFDTDNAYRININSPITLTQNTDIPWHVRLYVYNTLTVSSGKTLTSRGDIYLEQGGSIILNSNATLAQAGIQNFWNSTITLNSGIIINNGGSITCDGNSYVIISCDEYNSVEDGVAAAAGATNIVLDVIPGSQADISAAIAASEDYGAEVELFISSPIVLPNFDSIAQTVTLVLEPGSTLTIPESAAPYVAGAIILRGGTLINNGTLSLAGGLLQWNDASTFTNNGTFNVFPESYVRIARWNPISTATITNNGTVRMLGGNLDEGRIIISGGSTHYNTPDHADFMLPANVTTIEAEAFRGIGATSVYIHGGVTSIGSKAFAYCPNLQSISFGNGNISVEEDFLAGCPSSIIIIVEPGTTVSNNIDVYRGYLAN